MLNPNFSTAGVALAERVQAIAHEFPAGDFEHWTSFAVLRWPIPDDAAGLMSLADALVAEVHGLHQRAPKAAHACLEKLRTCVQRAERILPAGDPDLASLRRDVQAAELRLGVPTVVAPAATRRPAVSVLGAVTVVAMGMASLWLLGG